MGYAGFEELDVYRLAERIADRCYEVVSSWQSLDQETVGKQLIRAADSIEANIAEGHGRYYYGDQLRFLYYARGSLDETRHWMRRVRNRQLLPLESADKALGVLEELAKKLNAYISFIRRQRKSSNKQPANAVAEQSPFYDTIAIPQHNFGKDIGLRPDEIDEDGSFVLSESSPDVLDEPLF